MELHHRFTVPAGVEETWTHFNDIAGVAGCFPGATVTEADADSFSGTVKVKLGPIALVYNGTGTFVEKDEGARRMVIDAKGKDKRGNGTAGALVTATMAEVGAGQTEVDVSTDLSITGKAAQFGRGNVIKDVSDKLLGRFVTCLEERLGSGSAAVPDPAAPQTAAPEPAPDGVLDDARAGQASAVPDPEAPAPGGRPAAAPAAGPSAPAPTPAPPRREEDGDAIDLGATVLPVLLRAYWKPAAVALAVVGVVLWWVLGRD